MPCIYSGLERRRRFVFTKTESDEGGERQNWDSHPQHCMEWATLCALVSLIARYPSLATRQSWSMIRGADGDDDGLGGVATNAALFWDTLTNQHATLSQETETPSISLWPRLLGNKYQATNCVVSRSAALLVSFRFISRFAPQPPS